LYSEPSTLQTRVVSLSLKKTWVYVYHSSRNESWGILALNWRHFLRFSLDFHGKRGLGQQELPWTEQFLHACAARWLRQRGNGARRRWFAGACGDVLFLAQAAGSRRTPTRSRTTFSMPCRFNTAGRGTGGGAVCSMYLRTVSCRRSYALPAGE
jgi:hypothetical protein